MSKIVQYLNQHLRGEATAATPVLRALSSDNSVLALKPQVAAFARSTNDIRRIARFVTQLAEKNHSLAITARGGATSSTGATLGSGVILNLSAHMNQVLEFDSKQKQVRVQPGTSTHTLSQALALQGQAVRGLPVSNNGTVGGAVAAGRSKAGSVMDYLDRLEVVLASGDVIQTERLSRRELNRRIGKTGAEGDIYRQVDRLIEDSKELIDQELKSTQPNNTGYAALSQVKRKDGSFDLTPLMVGSAGTLGIISEMILKTDFVSFQSTQAVIAFESQEEARDLLSAIMKLDPQEAWYFDGLIFDTAAKRGAVFPAYSDMVSKKQTAEAVVYVSFDDFNERARKRKLKRLQKLVESAKATVATDETYSANELESARRVGAYGAIGESRDEDAIPLFEGFHIPSVQSENFITKLRELAKKLSVDLPLSIRVADNTYSLDAMLQLSKVGDRQKVFKISAQVSELIVAHGGVVFSSGVEGRLHAPFASKMMSAELSELYTKLRDIFDPHRILNPGVKEEVALKSVVGMLRSDYEVAPSLDELPGVHS